MRVMVMIKATENSEKGMAPTPETKAALLGTFARAQVRACTEPTRP